MPIHLPEDLFAIYFQSALRRRHGFFVLARHGDVMVIGALERVFLLLLNILSLLHD